MRSLNTILLTTLLFALAQRAEARTFRVDNVPHGEAFSCEVCHHPAGNLNDFGFDAFLYLDDPRGDLDWSEMAGLDSDSDGYTNGEELGDPTGTWRIGDPNPPGTFSNPGIAGDGLCGNDALDGTEECEGSAGETTCEVLGLGPGPVTCGDDCRFDTSQCDSCGDGVKLPGEECDGADFGGATCSYFQLGTGSLACNGCRLDTSGCSGPTSNEGIVCGDGVRTGNELCDGADLGDATCATLGYDGGTLACRAYCTFDTTPCEGDVPDAAVAGYAGPTVPEPGDDETPPIDEQPTVEERGCSTASSSGVGSPWFVFAAFAFKRSRRRRPCGPASRHSQPRG